MRSRAESRDSRLEGGAPVQVIAGVRSEPEGPSFLGHDLVNVLAGHAEVFGEAGLASALELATFEEAAHDEPEPTEAFPVADSHVIPSHTDRASVRRNASRCPAYRL